MSHPAEVRSISEIPIETADIKEAELKLARQIIEQQTSKAFDPSAYVDEFRGRLEAAIQRKVEGKEIALAMKPSARPSNVVDMMEILRASLAKGGKAPKAKAARRSPTRATR